MQTYPAPPPNPLFGIITWGFVILVIYGFVRLSNEGEARFSASKKTISFGIFVMVIVTLFETLSDWNLSSHSPIEGINSILYWIISMTIALPFILLLMIDLTVQWYILRR